MKIVFFNKNKLFNKKVILEKKKGENILIGGGNGSGKAEILLNIFSELVNNGYIKKSSVFINFTGDIGFFVKLISILNNKNDFVLFNAFGNEYDNFKQIDFKNVQNQNKLHEKHNLFLMPNIEETPEFFYKCITNQIFDYIENLPINKENEIPIFIDNISSFKNEDFDKYLKLIESANKKGYFFISSNWGFFNFRNFDINFPILQKYHSHFLIAKSEININNNFIKDINFQINLNELKEGNFYYLKNFKMQNCNILKFDYKFNDKKIKELSYFISQDEFIYELNVK